jgi:ribosomal protein S19
MARSLKKGPFVDHHLQKKVEGQNKERSQSKRGQDVL